jgi:hypothetical protein
MRTTLQRLHRQEQEPVLHQVRLFQTIHAQRRFLL